jgi:hypothetical protein
VGKKTPLTFRHMMEEQPSGKIKPLINVEDIMCLIKYLHQYNMCFSKYVFLHLFIPLRGRSLPYPQ